MYNYLQYVQCLFIVIQILWKWWKCKWKCYVPFQMSYISLHICFTAEKKKSLHIFSSAITVAKLPVNNYLSSWQMSFCDSLRCMQMIRTHGCASLRYHYISRCCQCFAIAFIGVHSTDILFYRKYNVVKSMNSLWTFTPPTPAKILL